MQLKENKNIYFKYKYDMMHKEIPNYNLFKYEDRARDELSTPESNLCMLKAFSNSPTHM